MGGRTTEELDRLIGIIRCREELNDERPIIAIPK